MRSATALAVCTVLLVTGCGGSSDDDPAVPAATTATTATAVPAATTATIAPVAPVASAGSVGFTDPEGFYTVTVSSTWKQLKSDQEKEYWALGGESGGFTPTLRLAGVPIPGIMSALSLEQYLDLNVQILQTAGLTLVKKSIIPGVNTKSLGAIEYTGKLAPGQPVTHSIDIVGLSRTKVATATLTALPDDYQKLSSAIVPYLSTLKVTG